MAADELQQAWIDRRPDAVHLAGLVVSGEARHVLDRNFDFDLHRLQPTSVDDRYLAISSTKKFRNLFERPLRGRKADALRLHLGQRAQPLEAEREVTAAFRRRDRMDLVDDQPADRTQHLA